jgi:hypothetical protein
MLSKKLFAGSSQTILKMFTLIKITFTFNPSFNISKTLTFLRVILIKINLIVVLLIYRSYNSCFDNS